MHQGHIMAKNKVVTAAALTILKSSFPISIFNSNYIHPIPWTTSGAPSALLPAQPQEAGKGAISP